MNDNETTTVEPKSSIPKEPFVILGLAGIGAVVVGKKVVRKVLSYRIVRKSKLDSLKNPVED